MLVTALKNEGISTFRAAPVQLVFIFVLAAIFGVLAAIWPARKASKLDVLEVDLDRVAAVSRTGPRR